MAFIVLDRMHALKCLSELPGLSHLALAVGRAILILTNPRTGMATGLPVRRLLEWTTLSRDEVMSGLVELERAGCILRPRPDAFLWSDRFCLRIPRLCSASGRPARRAGVYGQPKARRTAVTQRSPAKALAAAHRQWRPYEG